MPCGGIFPTEMSIVAGIMSDQSVVCCIQCGKEGADHFCEEWDGFLHANCVSSFLLTEEGKCVIAHKHEVLVRLHKED